MSFKLFLQKIRRPFKDTEENYTKLQMESSHISSDSKLKSFPYLHYRCDNFRIHVSKPIWILGFGFHGPYTPSNVSLHNLKIHIKIFEEPLNQHSISLSSRTKDCKVKIPHVILPIFFDKPVKLSPCSEPGYFNNFRVNAMNYFNKWNKHYLNDGFYIGIIESFLPFSVNIKSMHCHIRQVSF